VKPAQDAGERDDRPRHTRAQIEDECLELVPETADQLSVLRRWVDEVNGRTCPQPFLQEGPPGCFRLYVGDAAERIRTARGMQ
jgi:hypothetical protein